MPLTYDTVRLETLLALTLSNRWSGGPGPAATATDSEIKEKGAVAEDNVVDVEAIRDLPALLEGLGNSDRRALREKLRSYESLSAEDQLLWLENRLARVRAVTRERNRRFDRDIHTSQIVEALRDEPPLIQSLIVCALPASHAAAAVEVLGLVDSGKPAELSAETHPAKIREVMRQGFFERFVATDTLKEATPLDLLSVIELARLIRLFGVRETAIACQGIKAVDAVTAFLKRFSAEDAHAIISYLSALKAADKERIAFADRVLRQAINAGSDVPAAMLDRVGLALLALVLAARDQLRRRHIVQKLSIEAARELAQLMNETPPVCEDRMAWRVVEEAESLAANLRHLPTQRSDERRGTLSLQPVC